MKEQHVQRDSIGDMSDYGTFTELKAACEAGERGPSDPDHWQLFYAEM